MAIKHTAFPYRTLLIANQHQKEQVLAPLFQECFGFIPVVPPHFDTDIWGTFSGEVPRNHTPLEALQLKAKEAARLYPEHPFILVSEGSFGPHPSIPFIMADDEFLLFYNRQTQQEIIQRHISTKTNFSALEIKHWTDLENWAQHVQFPSHGVLLKTNSAGNSVIEKGITTWTQLEEAYLRLSKEGTSIQAETDMRAMHNPTRMQVIEEAAKLLIQKINSLCPNCQAPGFAQTAAILGLPCAWCGLPSSGTLKAVYQCSLCFHLEEKLYPHQKQTEDPRYCDYCNP